LEPGLTFAVEAGKFRVIQNRTENPIKRTSSWLPLALIFLVAACIFAIRVLAPPNLLDQDQERPASYVLDAVKNGNWICQRDWTGDITSKPPLLTWLSAIFTVMAGRISVVTLYLPGALAIFGAAVLIWRAGRRFFGERAGLFAALTFMLTAAGFKAFGLARTDGVFTFTVAVVALLAFHAWNRGGGWTWFWVAAAVSTLAKGPLGLMLGGIGLAAVWWDRKCDDPKPLRGSHGIGIALFLLIVFGWFGLAYWHEGQALIDKMLGKELVAHAWSSNKHTRFPGSLFYQPPLYYLGRVAPWSLLTFYGLWRLCKYPAVATEERRFERFLFCWFVGGMAIFCISTHQRADLLWPIMPAGALIAGRELSRWAGKFSATAVMRTGTLVTVLLLAGFGIYYIQLRARHPIIRQTVALKQLAAEIEREGGRNFPITPVDSRMTLQVYLDTMRLPVSYARAAELLKGPEPVFLAVQNLERLNQALAPDTNAYFTLLPATHQPDCPVRILSNRRELRPAK
jgi:4-amino-4-deoxy-L-arabinose transferase-like glycosyltransferase